MPTQNFTQRMLMKKFLVVALSLVFTAFVACSDAKKEDANQAAGSEKVSVENANSSVNSEKISVFVASSASKAFKEVLEAFSKANPNLGEIELIFGASGKHYQLLTEGREFDMFFSADTKWAKKIFDDGNAATNPEIYALGVVALYSLDENLVSGNVEALANNSDKIKHISIANPKVAPYGVAAEEVLNKLGIYETFKDRIVLGDNISQPVNHVDAGAAEVGLVAYSLVSPINKPQGKVAVVDSKYFSPLEQAFVITKYGKDKAIAAKFREFVLSPEGKAIIQKYGFGTN